MGKLDLRGLVSLSMDGPSVNQKLFDLFQKDHAEQYGGKEHAYVIDCCINVVSNIQFCNETPRKRLQEVSESLVRDADRQAEEAEGKAGSKMADLISRSNLLRRGHTEKLAKLAIIDDEIAAKSAELRS